MHKTLSVYYRLTKPGIIRANVLTGTAGFLFASRGNPDFTLLAFTLLGISLIIASACVLNNMLDRTIDAKMERTENRALVTGAMSLHSAGLFATVMGAIGFFALATQTNPLTTWVGVIAVVDYVVLYGYAKRRSVHGTLVGGIAGATAITAGYTAVTNQLNTTAIVLFLILFVWQLPHFYAIAVYRRVDYRKAGIPVLSVVKGTLFTQRVILACIPLFAVMAGLLNTYAQTSAVYLITMLAVSGWWLWIGLSRLKTLSPTKWGKAVFGSSLVVLLVFCLLISVDTFLP